MLQRPRHTSIVKIKYIILDTSVSERPAYREDFRFEKAFNSFYKLHSAASWSNARIRCEAEGSQLMVPDTLDEADAMPLLIASALTNYQGVYVGIHDFYTERYFVTIKGLL